MQMKMRTPEILGLIFGVIGIIGFFVLLNNEFFETYEAITVLLLNIAIGSVLFTLGKIVNLLEILVRNKTDDTQE